MEACCILSERRPGHAGVHSSSDAIAPSGRGGGGAERGGGGVWSCEQVSYALSKQTAKGLKVCFPLSSPSVYQSVGSNTQDKSSLYCLYCQYVVATDQPMPSSCLARSHHPVIPSCTHAMSPPCRAPAGFLLHGSGMNYLAQNGWGGQWPPL